MYKNDFDTDKLFMQWLHDKAENTKLSIIIKYILNSNEQL